MNEKQAIFAKPAGYRALPGGPLDIDRDFYSRIATAPGRKVTRQFEVPVREGRAWPVRAGSVFRISTVGGPQVGDLNIWSLDNPSERFWASRTRQLQRSSVTTFDRLWSCLPYLRPLVTVTSDTLAEHPASLAIHDLLGSRCDPYVNRMFTGLDADHHCHSNLVRAVEPFGLGEFDVHDVLNVFQFAGLNFSGEYFFAECPARPGDHIEFFAEIDVLIALSACPGGDLSVPMWGPNAASTSEHLEHCHPLGVEIIDIDPDLLTEWRSPRFNAYAGRHGLSDASRESA